MMGDLYPPTSPTSILLCLPAVYETISVLVAEILSMMLTTIYPFDHSLSASLPPVLPDRGWFYPLSLCC